MTLYTEIQQADQRYQAALRSGNSRYPCPGPLVDPRVKPRPRPVPMALTAFCAVLIFFLPLVIWWLV